MLKCCYATLGGNNAQCFRPPQLQHLKQAWVPKTPMFCSQKCQWIAIFKKTKQIETYVYL